MNKKGFTLVEMLTAMVVGTLVVAAAYGVMMMAQSTSANLDRKVTTQQDSRAVLDLMAMEIRMASYNPTQNNLLWQTTPFCWGNVVPVATPLYRRGIIVANANQLAFVMDLGGPPGPTSNIPSGVIGDANNEYIMYSYDGVATLTRATAGPAGCGAPQDLLGGTAPFTLVRNAAAGVTMFRYFNFADQEITATVNNSSNPINGIPAIRRILITIASETQAIDTRTGIPRRVVYSTNLIVRNHVLSPPQFAPQTGSGFGASAPTVWP